MSIPEDERLTLRVGDYVVGPYYSPDVKRPYISIGKYDATNHMYKEVKTYGSFRSDEQANEFVKDLQELIRKL